MQQVIGLEIRGWNALSSERDQATDFYGSVRLDNAIMLLPGGMRIQGQASIRREIHEQNCRIRMVDARRGL